MAEFVGVNLAVPSTAILKFDDPNKLAFDTSSWMHLKRYIGKVENLPAEFNGGSVATGEALAKLRSEARSFGSPKALRQALSENPNALADDNPPSMPYAAIVWLVQHLHDSAGNIVSYLQSLLGSARSVSSGSDVKAVLLELGRNADKARNAIGESIVSLKNFKGAILDANNAMSKACETDSELLHSKQERVGALNVQIEEVQRQIGELGFFSSKQKRKKLEEELQTLQQELEDIKGYSEKLRSLVGKIESILEDGAWLKSSLDDLVGFFDNVRKVWTAFGSGLTQLAADASDAQLEDLTFVKQALGIDKAIEQWTAIDQAAKQFTADSLLDIDIPNH